MNISSAENHVQKLLDYVTGLKTAESRMYGKSRNRLRDIAKDCQAVISAISELLQDEVLETESFEAQTTASEVLDAISTMQREADRLKQFVLQGSVTSSPSPPSVGVPHSLGEVPRDSMSDQLTPQLRREAFSLYAKTLQQMSARPSSYPAVHEIAQVLWSWFSHRFTGAQPTNFHYNIRRIPVWICHIILSYSKHLDQGTVPQFLREFYDWCDEVSAGALYTVPKSVYDMDTYLPEDMMTLTSVVLYDVLMDFGLYPLKDVSSSSLALSSYTLYDLVSEHCPEVLDTYTSYTEDPAILVRCQIALPFDNQEG